MAAPLKAELLKLDIAQRLELVEALWDSIIEEANAGAAISSAEREGLDQRLREDDEDPSSAIPWADAKARLRER